MAKLACIYVYNLFRECGLYSYILFWLPMHCCLLVCRIRLMSCSITGDGPCKMFVLRMFSCNVEKLLVIAHCRISTLEDILLIGKHPTVVLVDHANLICLWFMFLPFDWRTWGVILHPFFFGLLCMVVKGTLENCIFPLNFVVNLVVMGYKSDLSVK